MIPVHQTIFPDEENPLKGDCFAACLASTLELPLAEVPHVMQHRDWWHRTNTWLATLGLGCVEVFLDATKPALCELPPDMLVIVSGHTVRHPTRLHSVIARTLGDGVRWEYLHDPYPGNSYLTEATHLMWLAPLNPASFKEVPRKTA